MATPMILIRLLNAILASFPVAFLCLHWYISGFVPSGNSPGTIPLDLFFYASDGSGQVVNLSHIDKKRRGDRKPTHPVMSSNDYICYNRILSISNQQLALIINNKPFYPTKKYQCPSGDQRSPTTGRKRPASGRESPASNH
jgi:hypothetical protein